MQASRASVTASEDAASAARAQSARHSAVSSAMAPGGASLQLLALDQDLPQASASSALHAERLAGVGLSIRALVTRLLASGLSPLERSVFSLS